MNFSLPFSPELALRVPCFDLQAAQTILHTPTLEVHPKIQD